MHLHCHSAPFMRCRCILVQCCIVINKTNDGKQCIAFPPIHIHFNIMHINQYCPNSIVNGTMMWNRSICTLPYSSSHDVATQFRILLIQYRHGIKSSSLRDDANSPNLSSPRALTIECFGSEYTPCPCNVAIRSPSFLSEKRVVERHVRLSCACEYG